MAVKTLNLGGIDVELKCTAATSVLYRMEFGKDLFVEFNAYVEGSQEGVAPIGSIEMLEQAAYIMSRQANPKDKRTFIDWLDQFDDMMSFIDSIGEVADLLVEDRKQPDEPKKNKQLPQE